MEQQTPRPEPTPLPQRNEGPRPAFEPAKYLTRVSGADYLEVKWRLVWLRDRHPDAVIETVLVSHEDNRAIFRARVEIPSGGIGTGYGSEEAGDFRDYLEKAECVPLTVPILTRDGWRFYHQVSAGDVVLGYDVQTQALTWTVVQEVSTFPETALARIGNSRFSAVCTPDHRWVLNGRLTPWHEATQSGAERITLSAPLDLRGGQPDMAARLGWLFTDSQITYRSGLPSRAEVRQSKPENFAAIEELFGAHTAEREATERTWDSGRVSTCLPHRTWAVTAEQVRAVLGLYGVATSTDLSRAVLGMTRDEAEAFFDAAMMADGSSGTTPTFAKTDQEIVEAVQLAAFLTGRSSGIIKERAGNDMTTKPCLTVSIHKKGEKYTSEFRTTPLPPQKVWCPTTDTGTWVANFNGFIGITGNTKAIGRALACLGFGTQFCPDMEFGAGVGRVVDPPVKAARGQGHEVQHGGHAPDQGATVRQQRYLQSVAREAGIDAATLDEMAMHDFGVLPGALNRRDCSTLIDRIQTRRQDVPR